MRLKRIIRKFMTYDRIYYDGKLSTLLIVILSFLAIICLILGCIIF